MIPSDFSVNTASHISVNTASHIIYIFMYMYKNVYIYIYVWMFVYMYIFFSALLSFRRSMADLTWALSWSLGVSSWSCFCVRACRCWTTCSAPTEKTSRACSKTCSSARAPCTTCVDTLRYGQGDLLVELARPEFCLVMNPRSTLVSYAVNRDWHL